MPFQKQAYARLCQRGSDSSVEHKRCNAPCTRRETGQAKALSTCQQTTSYHFYKTRDGRMEGAQRQKGTGMQIIYLHLGHYSFSTAVIRCDNGSPINSFIIVTCHQNIHSNFIHYILQYGPAH